MSNCCEIALEVMEDVRPFALMIEECRELYAILTTPHLRVCTTLIIFYKGHLYKGQLLSVQCFLGLFSTVFLRDRYCADFTVSLINHIGCIASRPEERIPCPCRRPKF